MAQRAHCLKSFGILKSFAGIAPVYAVPVLRGNNGHIKDSEILVQSVKRGGSSSTSANHHGSRRFILSQISTGIKQPVQQGAEASRRSAKINWRTDDDTIRCFQFAAQHQISFILKDADAFLLAFVTTDTSLYRTIADVDNFRYNTFFTQCLRYFRKRGKRIPVTVWASVYQQHFQSVVFICSFHNRKAISPSGGHSVRKTGCVRGQARVWPACLHQTG